MIARRRRAEPGRAGLFLRMCRQFVPPAEPGQDPLDAVGRHMRFRASLDPNYADRGVLGVSKLEHEPAEMRLNGFVIAGLFGCLPEPYLNECRNRAADGDTAFASFLDIFNHRINALRFIAENADSTSAENDLADTEFGRMLRRLVSDGARFPGTIEQLAELMALLHLQDGSLSVAECLLERLLRVSLRLRPFAGGWVKIPERTRLGIHLSRLNETAVLGRRTWSAAEGVYLDLYLKPYAQFEDFLPNGKRFEHLRAVTAWVLRSRFDVHVTCFFDATDHPDYKLEPPWQNRLGRTSRLPERRRERRTEPVRFVLTRDELSNVVAPRQHLPT
jgi:type VI secretion system protein ImpH